MTWLLRLLEKMTPEIVAGFNEGLQQLLQKLYEMALKTENKWDDWGVRLMANTFGVELKETDEPTE